MTDGIIFLLLALGVIIGWITRDAVALVKWKRNERRRLDKIGDTKKHERRRLLERDKKQRGVYRD